MIEAWGGHAGCQERHKEPGDPGADFPGFKWCDFDHTPAAPVEKLEDECDLYLTNFATDCYAPLAAYLDNKYTQHEGKI